MARERVECDVQEDQVLNDNGRPMDGVIVTCTKCDHEEESCGTSARSVRRCLALMGENCPLGEENFYAATGGEDND